MDEIRFFHQQAERCRAAALTAADDGHRDGLEQLAERYDVEARRLNLAEIGRREKAEPGAGSLGSSG